MNGIVCNFCGEDSYGEQRKNQGSVGYYTTEDSRTACSLCMVRICPQDGNILNFVQTGSYREEVTGYLKCQHGPISGWGMIMGWDYRQRDSGEKINAFRQYYKEVIAWKKAGEKKLINNAFPEEDLGYVTGKWYLVKIGYGSGAKDLFVPARFLGIRRWACGKDHSSKAKCPGEAVFENVKPYGCGFEGADWEGDKSGYGNVDSHYYRRMVAAYREITLSEEWAVRAVENFCKVLTGQQKSFDIPLNNGYHFAGQLKPPSLKENLPGKYWIEAVNPATGKKFVGDEALLHLYLRFYYIKARCIIKYMAKKFIIILIIIAGAAAIAWAIFLRPPVKNIMNHIITIKTNMGEIRFMTYDADAPKAVNNFITLAQKGYYDNVIFHRVIDGFMIQGGDQTGTGRGGPGYAFEDELNPQTQSYKDGYKKGVVAMANAGPNTNGSQFFIMVADYPLPNNYTIFGKVISGQEVADAIAKLPTDQNNKPNSSVIMEKVTVSEPSEK